jgi:hypothetical protein
MRTKLFFLLLIIFCSCGRKNTNETSNSNSVIEIDLLSEPRSKVTKLSEIATNVEYIPLQTTKSSLLYSFILKIVSTDKRIYIENGGWDGEILCFDMDGKFLFKINNKGRGSGEYIWANDFDVSSDDSIMTILSSSIHKLLIYSIPENGFTFQRSLTLKDPAPYSVTLVPETDNAFLAIPPWRGTESTLSLLINIDGDTINFKPNCQKFKRTRGVISEEWLVYSIGNKVCFNEEFSDTVFYVDAKDNSFKPRIIFNTHGTLVTPEMWGHPDRIGDHTTAIGSIYETSRYIYYYYLEGRSGHNCILFDKTTKTKYKLDTGIFLVTIAGIPRNEEKTKLKDDLSGGPDFNIEIDRWDKYCSGGKLFSLVEAITLKKYVASEEFKNAQVIEPQKKNELKNLADSLNETDNPVLIIVTPKE